MPNLYVLTIVSAILLALSAHAKPVAKAEPGHMVIQYYKEQFEEDTILQNEKLRYRCESQIQSGYVSDPKCQEWIERQFGGAPSLKTSSIVMISMLSIAMMLV